MKEHALFLAAGFTPVNTAFAKAAMHYKAEFEALLSRTVALSNEVVGCDVLNSGEIVTPSRPPLNSRPSALPAYP